MAILDRFRKNKSEGALDTDKKQTKKLVAKTVASKSTKTKSEKKSAPEKKEQEKERETFVGKISAGEQLAHRYLLKPHVSEKAARLADQGVYVFDVLLDAEKVAVKKAVEAMYKVEVEKVRIVRGVGKPVRRGRRLSSRKNWKKALVQVKKGQTIDLYEGV